MCIPATVITVLVITSTVQRHFTAQYSGLLLTVQVGKPQAWSSVATCGLCCATAAGEPGNCIPRIMPHEQKAGGEKPTCYCYVSHEV
jgi:hypothetical protein